MSVDKKKDIVRRFIEEVVNKGNMAVADELIARDYIEHGAPSGLPPGIEGFKRFLSMVATAFPDIQVTIDDMICEGDKVVAV